jgi:hypothetical protein
MNIIPLPVPHEQRKVDKLLVKLATVKPISAKAPQSVREQPLNRLTGTAHSRVYYST